MTRQHHTRRSPRVVAALVALTGCLTAVCAAAPAAFASPLPAPGFAGTHAAAPVRVVLAGGMPGWQIALIAIAAAALASTLAIVVDRARGARRLVPQVP